jgi:hypothetical protein
MVKLYYIISNGIRLTGMPAWGSEDKPEAIWDLVSLIRRLPKLSPEELQRLQKAAVKLEVNSGSRLLKMRKKKPRSRLRKAKPNRSICIRTNINLPAW